MSPRYINSTRDQLAYERAKNAGYSNLYVGTMLILRLWDGSDREPWWAEIAAQESDGERAPHEIANDMHGRMTNRPYPEGYADLRYKLRVRAPLTDDDKQRIRETPDWLLRLPPDYDPTQPIDA